MENVRKRAEPDAAGVPVLSRILFRPTGAKPRWLENMVGHGRGDTLLSGPVSNLVSTKRQACAMVPRGHRGPRLRARPDKSGHFWIFHLRCCSGRFLI